MDPSDIVMMASGIAIVLLSVSDAVITAVNVSERSGWLSGVVLRASRPVFQALWSGPRRSWVSLAQILAVLASWIVGLWLGWWLILMGGPLRFIDTASADATVTTLKTLYLAGASAFALGASDIAPASSASRVVLPLASLSGLAVVTLAITYLLTLTQVAVHKRQVAWTITAAGANVELVVTRAWSGSSFAPIVPFFEDLANELALLAENQLSFPVLYELGSRDRDRAVAPALVRIVDAVELMAGAAAPSARLPEITRHRVLMGVDEVLRSTPSLPSAGEGEPADPDILRRLEVPLAEDYDRRPYARLRKGLYGLAVEEGWPLDIHPDDDDPDVRT